MLKLTFFPGHIPVMLKLIILNTTHSSYVETDNFDHAEIVIFLHDTFGLTNLKPTILTMTNSRHAETFNLKNSTFCLYSQFETDDFDHDMYGQL
jgi:hypothetical protein